MMTTESVKTTASIPLLAAQDSNVTPSPGVSKHNGLQPSPLQPNPNFSRSSHQLVTFWLCETHLDESACYERAQREDTMRELSIAANRQSMSAHSTVAADPWPASAHTKWLPGSWTSS
jgi:hypothetical protein